MSWLCTNKGPNQPAAVIGAFLCLPCFKPWKCLIPGSASINTLCLSISNLDSKNVSPMSRSRPDYACRTWPAAALGSLSNVCRRSKHAVFIFHDSCIESGVGSPRSSWRSLGRCVCSKRRCFRYVMFWVLIVGQKRAPKRGSCY